MSHPQLGGEATPRPEYRQTHLAAESERQRDHQGDSGAPHSAEAASRDGQDLPRKGQDATALQEPDSRSEATESLRGLVDAIALTSDQAGEALQIESRAIWPRYSARLDKRRGHRIPTTSPGKYRWLRGPATR